MDKSLVLYDGVCHLCNGFVRFIIKRDPGKHFQFGYLQSAESQEKLGTFPHLAKGIETVVLLEGGLVYTRSAAALRIARKLKGAWPLFYVFIVVPGFIRDAVYNFVGRHRYRLFGKSDQCMLPPEGDRDRFID